MVARRAVVGVCADAGRFGVGSAGLPFVSRELPASGKEAIVLSAKHHHHDIFTRERREGDATKVQGHVD